jgi:N-acetylglucosaminyldiphosphoundecaprenol N-acetyl-beta-D-mannosaminyltransferase
MKIDVLGIKIDAARRNEILWQILTRLENNQQTFIVTPYSESIVAAQKDLAYKEILNDADIALPDGIGILWAAKCLSLPNPKKSFWRALWQLKYSLAAIVFAPKFIRSPIPEKISGSEFVWDLCKLAEQNHKTIFLLGGFGDTAVRAAGALKKNHPSLNIAGTYEGNSDEPGIVGKVNETKADILLAAFGPVRQEKWLAENRHKLNASVLIGLGGTFDYLAGNRPPAPKFWAIMGLEWLWRLFTQPWRAVRISKGIFSLIYYAFLAKLK